MPEDAKQEVTPQIINAHGRMNARHTAEDLIRWHERQAHLLRRLLAVLPQELPQDADEALWQLLCNARMTR